MLQVCSPISAGLLCVNHAAEVDAHSRLSRLLNRSAGVMLSNSSIMNDERDSIPSSMYRDPRVAKWSGQVVAAELNLVVPVTFSMSQLLLCCRNGARGSAPITAGHTPRTPRVCGGPTPNFQRAKHCHIFQQRAGGRGRDNCRPRCTTVVPSGSMRNSQDAGIVYRGR